MALLIDIFGFPTVVLRGITLATQSMTIGGIAFIALLAEARVSQALGPRRSTMTPIWR